MFKMIEFVYMRYVECRFPAFPTYAAICLFGACGCVTQFYNDGSPFETDFENYVIESNDANFGNGDISVGAINVINDKKFALKLAANGACPNYIIVNGMECYHFERFPDGRTNAPEALLVTCRASVYNSISLRIVFHDEGYKYLDSFTRTSTSQSAEFAISQKGKFTDINKVPPMSSMIEQTLWETIAIGKNPKNVSAEYERSSNIDDSDMSEIKDGIRRFYAEFYKHRKRLRSILPFEVMDNEGIVCHTSWSPGKGVLVVWRTKDFCPLTKGKMLELHCPIWLSARRIINIAGTKCYKYKFDTEMLHIKLDEGAKFSVIWIE